MSEKYYAVIIDGQKSGQKYKGQQDCFPLAYVDFASGGLVSSGPGGYQNGASMVTKNTSFVTFDPYENPELTGALSQHLNTALTKEQKPVKLTFLEIMAVNNGTGYNLTKTSEHDNAVMHSIGDPGKVLSGQAGFDVKCDKSIVSTPPKFGDKPTNRTTIDHVNHTVNAE